MTDHILMIELKTPFGEKIIPETLVFYFSQGILGFEKMHYFALMEVPSSSGASSEYHLLQSLEDPSFCLVLCRVPTEFISPSDIEKNLPKSQSMESIELWSILNFHGQGNRSVTANLKAPIILDRIERKGWQIVLHQGEYPLEFKLERLD